jgi:hypothetical protein
VRIAKSDRLLEIEQQPGTAARSDAERDGWPDRPRGTAVWRLIAPLCDLLEQRFRPDAYNLGVNIGVAG